jgi:hypothetical protein
MKAWSCGGQTNANPAFEYGIDPPDPIPFPGAIYLFGSYSMVRSG